MTADKLLEAAEAELKILAPLLLNVQIKILLIKAKIEYESTTK